MILNWVTYADIMADYLNLKSAYNLPCSISICNHVQELTKVFCSVVVFCKWGQDLKLCRQMK